METKIICPLGSDCESIKNNQSHRCAWYIRLQGKHPQSEQPVDEWGCAIAWLPVLLIENTQTNRGQTQAIESFRNEMLGKQEGLGAILQITAGRK